MIHPIIYLQQQEMKVISATTEDKEVGETGVGDAGTMIASATMVTEEDVGSEGNETAVEFMDQSVLPFERKLVDIPEVEITNAIDFLNTTFQEGRTTLTINLRLE